MSLRWVEALLFDSVVVVSFARASSHSYRWLFSFCYIGIVSVPVRSRKIIAKVENLSRRGPPQTQSRRRSGLRDPTSPREHSALSETIPDSALVPRRLKL